MAAPARIARPAPPSTGAHSRAWSSEAPRAVSIPRSWWLSVGRDVPENSEAERRCEIRDKNSATFAAKITGRLDRQGDLLASPITQYLAVHDVYDVVPMTVAYVFLDGSGHRLVCEAGQEKIKKHMAFEIHQATVAYIWRKEFAFFKQEVGDAVADKFRMAVISLGFIRLNQLAEHIKVLRKILRSIANDKRLADLACELLFANVETTLFRMADGSAMLNLHSHVIYTLHRYLGKEEWWTDSRGRRIEPGVNEMDDAQLRKLFKARREGRETPGFTWHCGLQAVTDRMRELNYVKGYAHDAGQLEDFDECIKYMCKASAPADIEDDQSTGLKRRIGLLDLTDEEAIEYYNQTKRTNRFMSYGSFHEFRMAIKERVETQDPATGRPHEEPKKVRQKATWLGQNGETELGLVDRFSKSIHGDYGRENGDSFDIVVGQTMLPNRDRLLSGALLILNPSEKTLRPGGVAHLASRRGLWAAVDIHVDAMIQNLKARGVPLPEYIKDTKKLSSAWTARRSERIAGRVHPPPHPPPDDDQIGASPPPDQPQSTVVLFPPRPAPKRRMTPAEVMAGLRAERDQDIREAVAVAAAGGPSIPSHWVARAAELAELDQPAGTPRKVGRDAADRRREHDRRVAELCKANPALAALMAAFPLAGVDCCWPD